MTDTSDEAAPGGTQAADSNGSVRSAMILARNGDLPGARAVLGRAAAAGSVDALFVRGVVEDAAGNGQEAVGWYARAAEAGSPDAMFNLGATAEENGEQDTARAWYERAAAAGSIKALHNLGVRALAAGDKTEAANRLRSAADNGSAESAAALAALLAESGDNTEAAGYYRSAEAAGWRDPQANFGHGVVLLRLGDTEAARPLLLRAATADVTGALLALGDLARTAGQAEESEYWYATAGRQGSAAGMFGLGLVRADSGDFAGAHEALQAAARLGEPRAEAARQQLLEAARQNGRQ